MKQMKKTKYSPKMEKQNMLTKSKSHLTKKVAFHRKIGGKS